HPVIADMVDLDAVAVNFDGITYAKGASVLRQLVAWVGTENFMAGVRSYFAEYAWSNTEFSDLLLHLSQACGRELADWAQQWLHTTGVTTLSWQLDDDELTIYQSAPVRKHRVGIGFYNFVDGRLTRTDATELDLQEVTTVTVPAASLVAVNDRDLTYAKLRPDSAPLQLSTHPLGSPDAAVTRSLTWWAGLAWTRGS